jgi:hypothetical protein
MKNMHFTKPLIALAVTATFLLATPAQAALVVADPGLYEQLSAHFSTLGANLVRMQREVIAAIRSSAEVGATQTAKSAQLASESNQRTQTVMEQQRNEDRFSNPDGCAVVSATQGYEDSTRGSIARGSSGAGGGGGSRPRGKGASPNTQKALDIAERKVEAPSTEIQAAIASASGCSDFANPSANRVRSLTCEKAGLTQSNTNGHPDADIRAETLFDGPQTSGGSEGFRRKLTVDADGAERVAVDAYARNLRVPLDFRQLNKSELQTDAGRSYIAYRDSFEARQSLGEKAVRDLTANRTADKSLIPVLQQAMTSPTSKVYVESYLKRNAPNWSSRGISIDEFHNLEASRRYLNKDWHLTMASAPPETHVREQTAMLALLVLQNQRIAEKLDLIAVATSQTMSTAVRQEMVGPLSALHAKATK